MKKIHLISVLFALSLPLITGASSMSSNIQLNEQIIQPGDTVKLPLNKLYGDITYQLACTIKYQKPSLEKYSDLQIYCPPSSKIWTDAVNPDLGSSTGKIFTYETNGTVYNISDVQDWSTVAIRNLDYTDTLSVSCMASVQSANE